MRSLFKVGGYGFSLLIILVLGLSVSADLLAQNTLEFAYDAILVEVNSTDGYAGLTLVLDGYHYNTHRDT